MKRILPVLLALLGLATGCLPMQVVDEKPAGHLRSAAPVSPVTPESVTEKNAGDKAHELRAELDREAAREPGR